MNVSSVTSSQPILDIDPSQQAGAADATVLQPDPPPDVSEQGRIMQELSDLQKSDPAKFKEVAGEIAQKLRDAASGASGSQATFLQKLADKFDAASQSGDMSALQPAGGTGHAHGHHHAHKYAAQQQQPTAGVDAQQDQTVDVAQLIESTLDTAQA